MQPIHTRRWPRALLASTVMFISGLACAATPDWSHYNYQAVQQHVLPRYAALDEASAALSASTQTFCAAPSEAGLSQVQDQWRQAMQSWQGIQHVQFGPVQFLMRNFGLQFWPDRKNIGARQLRQALASDQPYDAEFFRHASVSIQGFPALERLLFADNALQTLQNGRGCELTQAIAGHVAQMSHAIHSEWSAQAKGDFQPEQDPDVAAELAVELMASLVEPIEAIRDSKLLKPMAESAESARPKLLESHRSSASLANIRANLEALNALYQGTDPSVRSLLEEAGSAQLARDIAEHFEHINAQLDAVQGPLKQAVTRAETHTRLLGVATSLKQLSEQLDTAMEVLNIQLGFNSRDGD